MKDRNHLKCIKCGTEIYTHATDRDCFKCESEMEVIGKVK